MTLPQFLQPVKAIPNVNTTGTTNKIFFILSYPLYLLLPIILIKLNIEIKEAGKRT